MGVRSRLAVIAGVVALFALMQVLSASASSVAHAPASAQSVIVVFKNQDRAQPATRSALGARRKTLAAVQGPVLQQLAAGNARDVHSFTTLNAVSATVSAAQLSSLRSDPAVAEVVPNGSSTSRPRRPKAPAAPPAPAPRRCPAPARPTARSSSSPRRCGR